MAEMNDVEALRWEIRGLVDERDPAQARTVYYGLAHSPERTQLHVERDEQGKAAGFVAACITGMNPFQPVVVLHAAGSPRYMAVLDIDDLVSLMEANSHV